ncbi:hypothetical protein [Reyranella sp.]|nr:hypothetical protein [Reyranella sp.]
MRDIQSGFFGAYEIIAAESDFTLEYSAKYAEMPSFWESEGNRRR